MGAEVEHYQIGQYQTERACFEERDKAVILAPQDNQVLYCLKLYTKGR
jgi:hypothetical protein